MKAEARWQQRHVTNIGAADNAGTLINNGTLENTAP
jgi:hypothetical protein